MKKGTEWEMEAKHHGRPSWSDARPAQLGQNMLRLAETEQLARVPFADSSDDQPTETQRKLFFLTIKLN